MHSSQPTATNSRPCPVRLSRRHSLWTRCYGSKRKRDFYRPVAGAASARCLADKRRLWSTEPTVPSSRVVGLVSLAIHPGGSFIYAGSTNALGAPAGIFAFSVDPTTGALSLVPGSPFSPCANSYFGGFNVPKAWRWVRRVTFYSQSASAKAACGLSQWTPRQEH